MCLTNYNTISNEHISSGWQGCACSRWKVCGKRKMGKELQSSHKVLAALMGVARTLVCVQLDFSGWTKQMLPTSA